MHWIKVKLFDSDLLNTHKKYFNYLRIYNENELKSMLINLNKYDYILKSKNVDKEMLLYKFIIENCE